VPLSQSFAADRHGRSNPPITVRMATERAYQEGLEGVALHQFLGESHVSLFFATAISAIAV